MLSSMNTSALFLHVTSSLILPALKFEVVIHQSDLAQMLSPPPRKMFVEALVYEVDIMGTASSD